MTTTTITHGKGKGSVYEAATKLNEVKEPTPVEEVAEVPPRGRRGRRGTKNKEEEFAKKEFRINDRFAKNNSHVIYFKDTCYKVSGTDTFEGGYSWRGGHAKYHISPTEKDPETGEHYVFQLVGDKPMKVPGETVVWPVFDENMYNTILEGRELVSHAKWKHKLLTDELMLKMKDDLHHIRLGKTRKRKAEAYGELSKKAKPVKGPDDDDNVSVAVSDSDSDSDSE